MLKRGLSPNGLYWWDGVRWISTLSPDGRQRWDGTQWVPHQTSTSAPAEVVHGSRQPTSWTRPLQLGVAGYFLLCALFLVVGALILSHGMTQFFHQAGTPAEVTSQDQTMADVVSTFFDFVFAGGAVIGIVVCAFGIVMALKRWTWAFYVILVLTAFEFASFFLLNLVGLVASPGPGANSIAAANFWVSVAELAVGAAAGVVFAWMFLALKSYGVWAMTDGGT